MTDYGSGFRGYLQKMQQSAAKISGDLDAFIKRFPAVPSSVCKAINTTRDPMLFYETLAASIHRRLEPTMSTDRPDRSQRYTHFEVWFRGATAGLPLDYGEGYLFCDAEYPSYMEQRENDDGDRRDGVLLRTDCTDVLCVILDAIVCTDDMKHAIGQLAASLDQMEEEYKKNRDRCEEGDCPNGSASDSSSSSCSCEANFDEARGDIINCAVDLLDLLSESDVVKAAPQFFQDGLGDFLLHPMSGGVAKGAFGVVRKPEAEAAERKRIHDLLDAAGNAKKRKKHK